MLRTIMSVIIGLLLASMFVTVGFAHEPGYEITIPQVTVSTRIDGNLDDATWRVVAPVEWGNINTGGEVNRNQFSRSWAVYDDRFIYVAFENLEPDTARLTTDQKVRDVDAPRLETLFYLSKNPS